MLAPMPTGLIKQVKAIALSPVSGVALFFFIAVLSLNSKFNYVDDAYYIMLAKSLAGGFGFSDIHLPSPHLHRHFPPGLPLFLSIPTLLGFDISTSVVIYKLLLIGCGALGLYLFARFAIAEGHSPWVASAAIVLSSVSIIFIGFTTRVASEMLYLLLSVGALIALRKYEQSSYKSRWLAVSALCLVASLLTRSIGILMLGAAVLCWVLKRKFRHATFLIISSAVLWLPWFILSKTAGAGVGSYYEEFLSSFQLYTLIERVLENGWLVLDRDIPRVILSLSASEFVQTRVWLSALLLPVRLGISASAIFPILRGLWPRPRVATIYLVCYLLLIIIWPWDPGRYVVPLVPFLCLSFIAGLEMLLNGLSERHPKLLRWRPAVFAVVIATCIVSQLISDARFVSTVRRSGHYTPEAASIWDETMMAYEWIRQNTAPSSIIGCEPAMDPHVYLFTDRKALALPSRPEAFKRLGVTHVLHITDPTMYKGDELKRRPDLQQFIKRASGKVTLTPVYQSDNVSIFEIN